MGRQGMVVDDPADLDLPVWNGQIPLRQVVGSLQTDSSLPVSPSVEALIQFLQKG